jgi:hypothetical protein
MLRLTVGWKRSPPLYGPAFEWNQYGRHETSTLTLTQGRVELDSVSTVDLAFASIVLPSHSELDDTLGSLTDLEDLL